MEQPETHRRIPVGTFILMLGTALFFDLGMQGMASIFNLIPAVGTVVAGISSALISLFACLTFFVWLKIRGAGFDRAIVKKTLTWLGLPSIEFIPVLNILPGWTAFAIFTFLIIRSEDILKSKAGMNFEDTSSIKGLGANYAKGKVSRTEMLQQLRGMTNEHRKVAREEAARERKVEAYRRRKEMQTL